MSDKLSWDSYFFNMLPVVALKSKDSSNKVGCIIVGNNDEIVSTGFNGFPRRVNEIASRQERPLKYLYTEHAERNAIYNAAKCGHRLEGARLYVSYLPCCSCARAIIQSGIGEVIISPINWTNKIEKWSHWDDSCAVSLEMFSEAEVKARIGNYFVSNLNEAKGLRNFI